MKQSYATFLFFLFLTLQSKSQVDLVVDSIYLKNLSNQSSNFKRQHELDSAIHYAHKLLSDANSVSDTIYIIKASEKLAQYHRLKNNYFKSIHFYNLSKELNLSIKDTLATVKSMRFICFIQKKLGDFNQSEITAIQALELLKNSNSKKIKLALYNNLGITSKEQKNYAEAAYWYSKALKVAKDTIALLNLKNNRAVTAIRLKNFKTAISELTPLLLYRSLANEPILTARIKDNLAFAKSKLFYSEAETELLEALQIRKKQNDLSGQFASHIHLANHFQDRDQLLFALPHAKKAYTIAMKIQGAEAKLVALSYLIDLKDNPKREAIAYRKLNDSLVTARNQAKNQFAKLKYDTDMNREDNLLLKTQTAEMNLQLAQKTIIRNWWIFIAFLLGLGLLFLIFRWRQKIKIAALNATSNTENRISKKVHDELANDISDIMTVVEDIIPITNPKKEPLMTNLETVYERTRDIATETGALVFGDSFDKNLKELLMQHHKQGVKVITNIDTIQQIHLDDHKKNAIYRALQELMVNMKKHSQATRVSIVFKKLEKHCEIRYTDNGIGADSIQLNNGLQNAETRMQNIGGSFTFESSKENGFKAILKFNS